MAPISCKWTLGWVWVRGCFWPKTADHSFTQKEEVVDYCDSSMRGRGEGWMPLMFNCDIGTVIELWLRGRSITVLSFFRRFKENSGKCLHKWRFGSCPHFLSQHTVFSTWNKAGLRPPRLRCWVYEPSGEAHTSKDWLQGRPCRGPLRPGFSTELELL